MSRSLRAQRRQGACFRFTHSTKSGVPRRARRARRIIASNAAALTRQQLLQLADLMEQLLVDLIKGRAEPGLHADLSVRGQLPGCCVVLIGQDLTSKRQSIVPSGEDGFQARYKGFSGADEDQKASRLLEQLQELPLEEAQRGYDQFVARLDNLGAQQGDVHEGFVDPLEL